MLSSAILVATMDSPGEDGAAMAARRHQASRALTPVLDRPLIAHAVAELSASGVKRIVVVADSAIEPELRSLLAEVALASSSLSVQARDPARPISIAVSNARSAFEDEPFLLWFADSIGRDGLGLRVDLELSIGEYDGVALMSRFNGSEAEPIAAGGGEPGIGTGEFQVGVFALGHGFPRAAADEQSLPPSAWMERTLEWMEGRGGHVDRRYVTGWWRHRGEGDPILGANRFMLAAMDEASVAAQVVDSDLEGAVRCDPSATVHASVLRGPVSIAAGAEIRNAFIGPFTSIGRDVSIDGAEIENSVVLEGSRISHIGGRLDSSVIGPHATISKDFRMPRGTRLHVGPGATVSFQ